MSSRRRWGLLLGVVFGCGCNNDAASAPIDLAQGIDAADLSAALDLAGPSDLAIPDLAIPDLSMPDLAIPDLSMPLDLLSLGQSDGSFDLTCVPQPLDASGVDAGSTSFGTCSTARECEGYATLPSSNWDPCQPTSCNGSFFCYFTLKNSTHSAAVPDDTPCDDNSAATYSYPATKGCPSNTCSGGANDGLSCSSDGDCPGGSCFQDRCVGSYCVGGTDANHLCGSSADCRGGGTCTSPPPGSCATDRDCYGSAANGDCILNVTNGNQYCKGGAEDGHWCATPGAQSSECPPVPRCVKWTADAASGSCKATGSNPYCDATTPCPTTKYCALDPENSSFTPNAGFASACGTNDDCRNGTIDEGPCFHWTCDLTQKVCVANTRACAGGPSGVGTLCNNVCRAGHCTSNFICK
jgi:hypothetical protein